MTLQELSDALLALCPNGQIEWDNNNQIIFYTGLTDAEDGTVRDPNKEGNHAF